MKKRMVFLLFLVALLGSLFVLPAFGQEGTASESLFDETFWTKIISCTAAILVAVPVLIFVKPKDRNLNRALKRRLSDFNRDLSRHVEDVEKENFEFSKKRVFNFLAALNACQKLSQQAAYDNDNVAIDTVRSKIGEARDIFSGVRVSRETRPSEYAETLRAVCERTTHAELVLDGILDNERRIRGKKLKKN